MQHRQLDDSHWIPVELLPSPPEATGTTPAVQVRGHAGTVGIDGDGVMFLVWLEKAGVWLRVTSVGVSRTDLVKYANGLRSQQLSGTEALHFTLVPGGMVVHETQPEMGGRRVPAPASYLTGLVPTIPSMHTQYA